jgi:GH43 family beta-xylosidase
MNEGPGRNRVRDWLRRIAVLIAIASLAGGVLATPFANPIVAAARTGSADPSVVFHRGYYYYCRSIDDASIGIARARRLQDIGAAPLVTVFRPPPGTSYSRQLWAPELQRIRGRWTIYFAASDGDNANHRMYALVALEDDPQGRYAFKGRVASDDDAWAIDGVALQLGNALYFVWSGWPGRRGDFPQDLYIAAMRDPWTIVGERHLIAAPEHDWERVVAPLLESPEPLRRHGKTFIVYSAAASWSDEYALGLLTYTGGDPLRAESWRKDPLPVFGKNAAARAFGVGHPSFVPSPDGREDWIVYHAMERSGAGWSGRSVRAQPFAWCADDTPRFGVAIAAGTPIEEPSGTAGSRSTRATMASPCR